MEDIINDGDYTFMKVYNKFCRTKEFLQFLRKAKCSTYYFLRASIVRESKLVKENIAHGAHASYVKHFLNGMLVGRYSVADIAEFNGTDKKAIIRDLKELEKDGFIKIIQLTTRSGVIINYYQLGVWSGKWGNDSYKERYFLDDHFDKVYDDQKTASDKNKKYEALINLMEFCDSFEHFVKLAGDIITVDDYDFLMEIWNEKYNI